MRTVNISDVKANFSRLVEEASKGESFIIAKNGRPMAKVIPMDSVELPTRRRIGFMEGQFRTPDDFDTMMADEIEEMFYGSSEREPGKDT